LVGLYFYGIKNKNHKKQIKTKLFVFIFKNKQMYNIIKRKITNMKKEGI